MQISTHPWPLIMKKMTVAMVLAICWLGFGDCSGAGALPGLSVKDGVYVKDGKAYRGVGCNYFDLFLRVLNNPTNTTSLQGLEKLSAAGIPFVRFAGPFSEKEWKIYVEQKDEYFKRMDLVVHAAEKAKIGLIPSMFWTLNLPRVVGETRDQWGNTESKTLALMRQYVGDVVSRYKDSPALWGWEFGNEPNLMADLPNAANFRPPNGTERDDLKATHLVVMLSEFAKAVRVHDKTRPIFAGNSHSRFSSWHNTAEKSWKADTREQAKEIILRDNPAPLDTMAIHYYGDNAPEKELGSWVTNRVDYLKWLKEVSGEVKRPVWVGEFGVAAKAGKTDARQVFEELIVEMQQAKVDLAAFWVFDLKSQDKDWNVTFDNERSFMITLTAEANRRWRETAGK